MESEGGSRGAGGWVQIKPSSGGLTCLECVSVPAWLRDRHSAPGALDVLSNIQTPCLQCPVQTETTLSQTGK